MQEIDRPLSTLLADSPGKLLSNHRPFLGSHLGHQLNNPQVLLEARNRLPIRCDVLHTRSAQSRSNRSLCLKLLFKGRHWCVWSSRHMRPNIWRTPSDRFICQRGHYDWANVQEQFAHKRCCTASVQGPFTRAGFNTFCQRWRHCTSVRSVKYSAATRQAHHPGHAQQVSTGSQKESALYTQRNGLLTSRLSPLF